MRYEVTLPLPSSNAVLTDLLIMLLAISILSGYCSSGSRLVPNIEIKGSIGAKFVKRPIHISHSCTWAIDPSFGDEFH